MIAGRDKRPGGGVVAGIHRIGAQASRLLAKLSGRAADKTPAAPADAREFAGVRVLLAEDNFVNREVAQLMLELLGCEVDVAENGKEAIAVARARRYDLTFMDCQMPEVDGFAAAAAIRAMERELGRPRGPIIAITAASYAEFARLGHDAEIDDHLEKPIESEKLAGVMRKWLRRTGADARTPPASAPSTPDSPAVALDPRAVERLRQLGQARGEDVLGKVARLYLDTAPDQVAAVRDAAARGDLAAVGDVVHALKSASANLGAMNLSRQCLVVERAAGDGDAERLPALVGELGPAAEAVFRSVRDLLPAGTEAEGEPDRDSAPDGSKRIMIVDDDAAFRLATRAALQTAAFATAQAADGEQALALFATFRPDLVLLDAVMRGIDGFETCRRLRGLPGGAAVPVLMVTGLNDVASVEMAFHAGATGFASKPVSYPVLIQQIQFMLRASANETALREHKAALLAAQRIARLGYWRWNRESGRFELSENLCELFGIAPGEAPTDVEGYVGLAHEDDRAAVREQLHDALQRQHPGAFSYRIRGGRREPAIVQQEIELLPAADGDLLLGTVQDVTEQRRSEERIRHMAYVDTLTGLASRNHLMQHIDEMVRVARRRGQQFTLLLLDLDGFKDVNDSLGHDIGDGLLVSVAQRLRGVVRDIDFVARLGGDEFCLLLDDSADELDAAEVATRCLEVISQPVELAGQRWRPQASIGLARFPADGDSTNLLLKAADSAMYAAKQAGKHRFAFYRAEMTDATERRLAQEQLLREAIEKEQFVLHYQPQIDLHSGHIVGVEALARWRHPLRGTVMPGDFIPTLERIGLICRLGDWVIATACRQAAAWIRAGLPEIRMAVNVSPLHLLDPEMVGSVQGALADAGLPPYLLEIEITESSVQSDAAAMQVLERLQELGVRITIDDFGTGYSSLGSLKQLPINTLKIDRVFVADMLNNDEDAVMLGTIIGLSHALGYTVVAEGVEEREQAAVLAGLNCDLSQGFYFSRPVPAEEIPALVNRGPHFRIDEVQETAVDDAQRGTGDA